MNLPVLDRAADAERYEVISGGFDQHLFAAAAIGAHDHVLDIGCGYGRTTVLAARRARSGRVVGNDVVAPVLEQARAFAAAEGLGNVTFECGDAQHHSFQPAGFTVAISRFGVMFFTDPVTAFANIGRALRPGGRLVFTTVGPPHDNDLPQVIAAVTPSAAPAAAPSDVPTVHSLSDPDHIGDVLTRAGFAEVAVRAVETTISLGADAATAAEFILQWGAFRGLVDETSAAAVDRARAQLIAAAQAFHTDGAIRLRSTAWLVTAARH